MKNLLKILTGMAAVFAVPVSALAAVCPVCVVGVGAGLAFADVLGVDYSVIGLWSGGLMLALTLFTANWLKKKGVVNMFWYFIVPFVLYYGMLLSVYAFPEIIVYNEYVFFGIDKLLLGIVVGTLLFYFGAKRYSAINKSNGGKSQYPFQKVVLPIEYLLVGNVVLWLATKYI